MSNLGFELWWNGGTTTLLTLYGEALDVAQPSTERTLGAAPGPAGRDTLIRSDALICSPCSTRPALTVAPEPRSSTVSREPRIHRASLVVATCRDGRGLVVSTRPPLLSLDCLS
jgi:hypothetical protein